MFSLDSLARLLRLCDVTSPLGFLSAVSLFFSLSALSLPRTHPSIGCSASFQRRKKSLSRARRIRLNKKIPLFKIHYSSRSLHLLVSGTFQKDDCIRANWPRNILGARRP